LGDLGEDVRIILKWILKETEREYVDWIQGPVERYCERKNGSSGTKNGGMFLEKLSDY
jgi:hypothetical protein